MTLSEVPMRACNVSRVRYEPVGHKLDKNRAEMNARALNALLLKVQMRRKLAVWDPSKYILLPEGA